MAFVVQAQLMRNQQAADLVKPGKDFSAVQTTAGYAVFFTATSDNKLNAIRETSHDSAHALGWQKVDLTPKGVTEIVDFAIAQNPATLNFDVAVVGVVAGKHSLWISQNNSADVFQNFNDGAIVWQELAPPTNMTISKLYIMNLFSGSSKVQMIYADVYRDPRQQSKLIDRYLINPSQQPYWFSRSMGADFSSGSMRTCVGRPKGEITAGVYTFGILNTSQQLIYQPSMLGRAPGHTGNVTRLIAPPNSYSIASAPAQDGLTTNLFVAAKDGLHLFTPDKQFDGATSQPIFDASQTTLTKLLFAGIEKMTARWMGDQVVLFLLNTKQQLLYTSCEIGKESTSSAWSMPVPICSQVKDYAFYVDTEASKSSQNFGNVVFAEVENNQLIVLDQNLSTGIWSTSSVLLPTSSSTVYHERTTFTAQVRLVDKNSQPIPSAEVEIYALSHATFFIDGVCYVLDPNEPVSVKCKRDGSLVIVQDATSLAAASFTLTSGTGPSTITATVDPSSNVFTNMKQAQTTEGIKKVQLTDASGKTRPLVPDGADTDTTAASVSKNIGILLQARTDLADTHSVPDNNDRGRRSEWGWNIDIGDLVQLVKDGLNEIKDGVVTAVTTVTDFVVEKVKDKWRVVLKIGEDLWNAVIDTVQQVGDAAVAVFDAVAAAVDDLISWLGFLFEWKDIQRTHKFLVQTITLYLNSMTAGIDDLIKQSETAFAHIATDLKALLNPDTNNPNAPSVTKAMAGKAKLGKTIAPANGDNQEINSPQANWGSQKLQEHGSGAKSTVPLSTPDATTMTGVNQKVGQLKTTTDGSQNHITDKLKKFNDEVLGNIMTMDVLDVVRQTCNLCIDIVEVVGTTLITSVLRLVKDVLQSVIDGISKEIEIPVISGIYKDYISDGSPLSVLDVTCLVMAVPATVLYKATTDAAPFPDEDTALYKSAMQATTWSGFLNSVKKPQTPKQTRATRSEGHLPAYLEWQILANLVSIAGTLVLTMMIEVKRVDAGSVFTNQFLGVGIGAFAAYLMPNISSLTSDASSGVNIANDVHTACAFLKAVADYGLPWALGKAWSSGEVGQFWANYVSPILDTVINVAWFIVLIVGYATGDHKDRPDYDATMFAGNLFFDVSGIIAPLASPKIGGKIPEVGPAVVVGAIAAGIILNGGYGFCSWLAALFLATKG